MKKKKLLPAPLPTIITPCSVPPWNWQKYLNSASGQFYIKLICEVTHKPVVKKIISTSERNQKKKKQKQSHQSKWFQRGNYLCEKRTLSNSINLQITDVQATEIGGVERQAAKPEMRVARFVWRYCVLNTILCDFVMKPNSVSFLNLNATRIGWSGSFNIDIDNSYTKNWFLKKHTHNNNVNMFQFFKKKTYLKKNYK